MTSHGDDCYFFYYSTCTKGDSCPFRHCEAAMGSETVCNLWQEGRCFRMVCKYRHMEIKKNRREIACYWENQPAGCQKSHCAFHHEKPRFVDGLFIPADKGSAPKEVAEPQEDPAPPPPAPAPLATAANPQVRGVIKAETQENVPSPTHPPVVINPADDDEDEDDQFSEEEASPRKLAMGSSSDDSLNFGIRTLEEIRLRKALKASMKRYGRPLGEDPDALTGQRTNGVREKENIRSYTGGVLFPATDDILSEATGRRNVAERLGNRIIMKDVPAGSGDLLHPKRRLAERLGRIVDEEESGPPPQKALKPIRDRLGMPAEPAVATEPALKPIRDRLGMPAEPAVATEPAEPPVQPGSAPPQVHVKTLEEIRLAKAAKNQNQKTSPPAAAAPRTSPKVPKRMVTVKPASVAQAKTFSEFIHAKRKLGEEEQPQLTPQRLKKAKAQPAAEAPADLQGPADAASPGVTPPAVTPPAGAEVRVKTLEEIRREKAARALAARDREAGNVEGPEKSPAPSGEEGAKKPRLLRLNKPASPAANAQRAAEHPGKPVEPSAAATEPRSEDGGGKGAATNGGGGVASTGGGVKVKTFEEIMREKRLRRQQLEEQAASASQSDSSVEAEPASKRSAPPPPTGPALQRRIPVRAGEAAGSSPSSSPNPTPEAPPKAVPVRQRVSLRPKASAAAAPAAAPPAAPAAAPAAAPSPQRGSPPRQAEADSPSLSPKSSSTSPGKRKRVSPATGPSKQARGAASPRPSTEETAVSQAQDGVQRKSPGQATEAKVRPKLNVKPSVVKPAAQVKPGQKRKAAESAVAEVKPLTSGGAREEPASPRKRASPQPTTTSVEAQPSPPAPRTPVTPPGPAPGSASPPPRVELQTSPVAQHSPGTTPTPTPTPTTTPTITPTSTQRCTPPESPVTKTPSRPRRPSVPAPSAPAASSAPSAAAASSAEDELEDLLNEFTGDGDDPLEDEMELDHGKGEDDLLLELSEMIDS